MRIQDKETIQKTRAHHAPERVIRMAGNLCVWVGEAFIGLSRLYLSWISRFETKWNIEERQTGPLLPVHRCRNVDEVTRCPNCFREIKSLVETIRIEHGFTIKTIQCEDCTEIHSQHLERLEQAKWN